MAQARAEERWKSIDQSLGPEDGKLDRQSIVARSLSEGQLSAAVAATRIATTPLYLTKVGDGFMVRAEDDRESIVQGVDLSNQFDRLRGVHAAQERELTQLRAYVRRHGRHALNDAAMKRTSPWMQRSARKWRDTAVFDRMSMADRGMAKAYAQFIASPSQDEPPQELPKAPALEFSLPDRAFFANNGVLFTPRTEPIVHAFETVEDQIVLSIPETARQIDLGRKKRSKTSSDLDPSVLAPNSSHLPIEPNVEGEIAGRTPDGFGGWRNTAPPVFIHSGSNVRLAPLDAAGRPTAQLLRLLLLAGKHPHTIVVATDGRLMVEGKAPAMLEPLLHGWRDDPVVGPLVSETVRLSRHAGSPDWPANVAVELRAFASKRKAHVARRPPPDLNRDLEVS